MSERLEELGFLDYASPSDRERISRELRRDASSGIFEEGTNRFFFADAEDLAEGGVGAFLAELEPTLSRLAVPPFEVDEQIDTVSYSVTVAGREYPLYSEAENAREDEEPGIIWGLSAARTVGLLNDLLTRAGAAERAWGCNGGNGFGVYILTPELRDAVSEALGRSHEEPYEPTEDYPSFGQPRV